MKSTIVGTKYRGPEAVAVLARLRPGDRLRLVREPENAHDPNAVAVYSELLHLGYLPRGVNRPVSDLIMSADTVHAIVTHEAIVEEGQVRFGPRIQINNHFDLFSRSPDG